ncbi:MAG TPA: GNAT family N-acetyltransferase [Solirubrobacteraceae bacterium]|nr:GNAT family N-acetyltransferase [Solirubrobacteraceae bacterium]
MSVSPQQSVLLGPLTAEHWPAVARIYAAGIAGGNATFEHAVPDWDRWLAARLPEPCLVARAGGKVIGWAALSPTSSRPVYRGVGSVSIYVDPDCAGRGVGTVLLSELVAASERVGLWTLEAGIFPENAASIALHLRCGFRLVGARQRVGQMQDGRWRDVLLYERRSQLVGSD